jgi:hypothetical protein
MALTQTQVSQLYVALFGRASEGSGNFYWQSVGKDMAGTAQAMLETQAAKDYFGSTLDDNQAFIDFIYQNTLGKTYADDPAGIDYWVNALNNWGLSKAQVVTSLIEAVINPANAGPAQDMFNNKVAVSDYCAERIAGTSIGLDAVVGFIDDVTNIPVTLENA